MTSAMKLRSGRLIIMKGGASKCGRMASAMNGRRSRSVHTFMKSGALHAAHEVCQENEADAVHETWCVQCGRMTSAIFGAMAQHRFPRTRLLFCGAALCLAG